MALGWLRNKIYTPDRFHRSHIEDYVKTETYVIRGREITRFRNITTGRFVSTQYVARLRGTLRYWNTVKAATEWSPNRTFRETQELLRNMRENWKRLSETERRNLRDEIFGYGEYAWLE